MRLVAMAVMRISMSDGRKDDAGKPRYDLLPLLAVDALARVLEFGARKYAPENWRLVPDAKRRYWAAALRHLCAWARGERCDAETGENHLAHAMCCVAFILELDERETRS